eukprot:COSAG01_NODE_571_length_15312_cov_149.180175_1_plen_430_part_00
MADGSADSDVVVWLRVQGLGEYAAALEKEGFDSLEDLRAMDVEDLADLCEEVAGVPRETPAIRVARGEQYTVAAETVSLPRTESGFGLVIDSQGRVSLGSSTPAATIVPGSRIVRVNGQPVGCRADILERLVAVTVGEEAAFGLQPPAAAAAAASSPTGKAAAPAQAPTQVTDALSEQLAKLRQARELGALSEEQYELTKARLVAESAESTPDEPEASLPADGADGDGAMTAEEEAALAAKYLGSSSSSAAAEPEPEAASGASLPLSSSSPSAAAADGGEAGAGAEGGADPAAVEGQLAKLQQAYELGALSEEQHQTAKARLMAELAGSSTQAAAAVAAAAAAAAVAPGDGGAAAAAAATPGPNQGGVCVVGVAASAEELGEVVARCRQCSRSLLLRLRNPSSLRLALRRCVWGERCAVPSYVCPCWWG